MFVDNARIKGAVYLFNSNPSTLVFQNSLVEGDPSWAASISGISAWETVGVVHNSVIRSLPIGLDASSSIFLLSKSTITGNKLALRRNTDQPMFQSAGDNVIRGNTDDALGIVTPLALH